MTHKTWTLPKCPPTDEWINVYSHICIYIWIKIYIYIYPIDYAKAFDCVHHNKLWKILKEMGILNHLTCLLRNLYAGQEAIVVRTGHGTTDWFQIGKGVCQGCILSPCLFNFYAEYIMWNAGLDDAQAGIKIQSVQSLSHVWLFPTPWTAAC